MKNACGIVLLLLLIANSGCEKILSSGASNSAKTFTGEDAPKTSRGPRSLVFQLPKAGENTHKAVGIQIKNASIVFDLKKMYAPDTTEITEFVQPGDYEYRILYVDDSGHILFDSSACQNAPLAGDAITAMTPKSISVPHNADLVISVEMCPNSGILKTKDTELGEFDRLNNPDYAGADYPPLPRRFLSTGSTVISKTSMEVKLGVKVWDFLSISTTAATTLATQYRADITLIKHARSPDTELIVPETSEVFYEEGVGFVAQCNYVGAVTGSKGSNNRIGISVDFLSFVGLSSEAGYSLSLEKATSVQAQSKMFSIRKGDTIETLRQRCHELFSKEVKESVEKDLKQAASQSLFLDNRENFDLIAQAALFGPDIEGVIANGVTWNVKKIDLSKLDNQITITGELAHQISMWFDDRFCYKITLEGPFQSEARPQITYQRYDNCNNEASSQDWFAVGKDIARNIALEAWQENKN